MKAGIKRQETQLQLGGFSCNAPLPPSMYFPESFGALRSLPFLFFWSVSCTGEGGTAVSWLHPRHSVSHFVDAFPFLSNSHQP